MIVTVRGATQWVAAFCVLALAQAVMAADPDDQAETNVPSTGRYGLFNGLDHRSAYTQDVFPEPFIVDDMALEDTEFEFDWGHSQGRGSRSDTGSVEFQKGIGLLTFEAEIPFQHLVTPDSRVQGVGPMELGLRYPLLQYVSPHQAFDNTFGFGMESEIPLQLRVDPNTELEPLLFWCLSLGRHFTAQTVLGKDFTLGPGDNGGERDYEMGTSLAYGFSHEELPIPCVQDFYPMFEVSDELGLNKDEQGQHDFQGAAGFRVKFTSIGEMSPSFGAAYVFPLDEAARDRFHWGFIVSVILDF